MANLREYVDQRFEYMERGIILKYAGLLKDFGMLFEDADLIQRLHHHFKGNYSNYELSELI